MKLSYETSQVTFHLRNLVRQNLLTEIYYESPSHCFNRIRQVLISCEAAFGYE